MFPGSQLPFRAASSVVSNFIPTAVLLDVDGVLIDPVDVEGAVFVKIFANFSNSADQVLAFHRAHGSPIHKSEFDKSSNYLATRRLRRSKSQTGSASSPHLSWSESSRLQKYLVRTHSSKTALAGLHSTHFRPLGTSADDACERPTTVLPKGAGMFT